MTLCTVASVPLFAVLAPRKRTVWPTNTAERSVPLAKCTVRVAPVTVWQVRLLAEPWPASRGVPCSDSGLPTRSPAMPALSLSVIRAVKSWIAMPS